MDMEDEVEDAGDTIAMPEMELTDEEAQAIISFADKLEAAMGDDMGDEDLEGIEDVEEFEEEGEEEPLEEADEPDPKLKGGYGGNPTPGPTSLPPKKKHKLPVPTTEGISESLVDALTQRVAARLMEAQGREAQNRARKEQIAESVANRIMKRLES